MEFLITRFYGPEPRSPMDLRILALILMLTGLTATNAMALEGSDVDESVVTSPELTVGEQVDRAKEKAPEDAFRLRNLEWIPRVAAPPPIVIQFPNHLSMASVEHLTVSAGRLWVVARPRMATNLPPRSGVLWSYSMINNRIQPVRGMIEQHHVRAAQGSTEALWLALDGGVAKMDARTLVIDTFTAEQGLTTETPVAFATHEDRLHVMADHGAVFRMNRNGRTWSRLGGSPEEDPLSTSGWSRLGSSGDWLMALGQGELAVRHALAPNWEYPGNQAWEVLPDGEPPEWLALEGDGKGRLWIGSHLGWHIFEAESGRVEHQLAPLPTRIQGGLNVRVPTGFRAKSSAATLANSRVAEGIRARMRDRARFARVALERRKPLDFYTPSSRLPGGVTALCLDRGFLWVATTDGPNQSAARILLYHAATDKWVGWFRLPLPVRCLTVDDQHLWVGLDASSNPRAHPLAAIPKHPLLAIPIAKWQANSIAPEEMQAKLAGLPGPERAVLAFFANDPVQVVRLLASDPDLAVQFAIGTPDAEKAMAALDAEQLFLLAFAHDPIGLDQPDQYRIYLDNLHQRFPKSPYALATRALLQGPTVPTPALPGLAADPQTKSNPRSIHGGALENDLVESTATEPLPDRDPSEPPPNETITAVSIMARRDLNRDGTLNLVELRLWLGPEASMEAFDLDGDGKISLEELDMILQPLDLDAEFPDD